MATYNGASFINEQLLSLAAQTLRPFELIVSDDGSVDATLELVEAFSKHSPFPVLLRRNEKRLGYGENFLRAAELATGEYIAFCDQDDVWCDDKLEVALAELTLAGADLFVHTVTAVDAAGNRIGEFSQRIRSDRIYPPLQLGPWSVFYGCTMVFPRGLLALLDPARRGKHTFEHEGTLSHDLWVYFLAVSLGRVVVATKPLVRYRQHHGNMTPHVLRGGFQAWTSSLGVAADPNLPRREIAQSRSELMDELGDVADELRVRQAAKRAATYWRRISEFESARLELYSAPGVTRRALRCGRLVRSGGYRSFRKGGLGERILLKDVLVGVLQARRLQGMRARLQRPPT
jgi:glycosyltransferase involved in cell wall biosynthesis